MGTITLWTTFSEETAKAKVKATKTPGIQEIQKHVAQAYTDSKWRNRSEFFTGREPLANINPKEYASVVFQEEGSCF